MLLFGQIKVVAQSDATLKAQVAKEEAISKNLLLEEQVRMKMLCLHGIANYCCG
jgi:hypothetical protein